MNLSIIPNLISGLRFLLVGPMIYLLQHQQYTGALIVFVVAGASDALDGYLARRFNWQTRLGGWLDPIADKLMQLCTFFMLAWLALIPYWLFFAIIIRDLTIVTGGVVYYWWVEKVDASPTWISKVNTLLQILLVVTILSHQVFYLGMYTFLVDTLIISVFATTVLSGVSYVWIWAGKAWRAKRGKKL